MCHSVFGVYSNNLLSTTSFYRKSDFSFTKPSADFAPIGAVFPVLNPVISAILSAKALINKKRGRFSLSFFFLTSKITFPAAPTKDKPYMTTAAHCGEAAVWMIGRRRRPRATWLRRRIYLFVEGNVCSLVGVVLVNGRSLADASWHCNL